MPPPGLLLIRPLELPLVLAEVLDNLLLRVRVEKRRWPRPPHELVELLRLLLEEVLALECVQLVSVVHLELVESAIEGLSHRRRHYPPRRIPLDVVTPVVVGRHALLQQRINVVELQRAIVVTLPAQHDMTARRRPVEVAALALLERLEQQQLLLAARFGTRRRALHRVERHARRAPVAMHHREPVSTRLPRHSLHPILDVKHLDRDKVVAHTEELEVVVLSLLRLRVTSDLDAKVVAVGLPAEAALVDVEKVLLADGLARRD
mmetsp:Transcript_4642/g.9544  ORF Transcript_4642/g.9544 Transcript_4642/m.9544 type:complete len:263 (+) Transcript_4642:480-1268(+)